MEDYQRLRNVFNAIEPLAEEAWQAVRALFRYGVLDKGEYFVKTGEKNYSLAFVLEGAMRAYVVDKEGTYYNKTFFVENSFAISLASVFQDIPSFLSFDALLDTKLLFADYRQLEALFEQHRCLETLVRKYLQFKWVIQKEQRELRFVLQDASERYAHFQQEYPGLESKIPQYHIASHLGITPIQLSRIRSRRS